MGRIIHYKNHYIKETFTKNDCSSGQGTNVTYTVPANTYTSSISQADADAQAENQILTYAQANANAIGSCLVVYYNVAQSQTVTSQSCGDGKKGGPVTYVVPAGRYSSTISQADADAKATIEMNANVQANANDPAHQVCSIDYTPQWEGTDDSSTSCQTLNGVNSGHKLMHMLDVNPNSSTYNTSQWMDVGVDTSACPMSSGYPNLIINGNFENGNGTFGTDYTNYSGHSNPGNYAVGSNPHDYNSGFCSMSNHTAGGSKMLVVDGSYNANDRFWYGVVNVTANRSYKFTYWCASLDNGQGFSVPNLQLKINGVAVLENPRKETPVRQNKQTPVGHFKLTP